MEPSGRHKGKRWLVVLVVPVLIAGYCTWTVRRPAPVVAATQSTVNAKVAVPAGNGLSWPGGAQAAVGISGSSILQTHGTQVGTPTASTAKLITALAVLRQKPLKPGQQGPVITLTAADVALFNSYNGREGSVVPVQVGEQITEYQMLQAIMLPSANNIADSLAIWAFGSLSDYATYANGYVSQLGLTATHIGSDASGFDPSTVSSAHDLVKLGELAMQNPVLAEIVGQKTAVLPVGGLVRNVNYLLGSDGFVGVKTGNTDQAGGVFVGATEGIIGGKQTTIVTAVTGSTNLAMAMKDSLSLMQSAQNNFQTLSVVEPGNVVARYQLPWGGSVSAVADTYIRLRGWGGGTVPYSVHLKPLPAQAVAGDVVGTVNVPSSAINQARIVTVKLQTTPPPPPLSWRLTHPLN
ncbi:MAG TPA: hypothetical protein VN554_02090 [Verrucomicrobiae bacterium]|nr:hypothetical protein [Verrucomicrobiae bacterium]